MNTNMILDCDKSYDELMMDAQLEYLDWLDEGRHQKKMDKAKFKAARLAKLHMREIGGF